MDNRDSHAEEMVPFLEVEAGNDNEGHLPPPANAPSPEQAQSKLSVTVIVPIWIALSSAVILYNNYLYNTLDFKYPVSHKFAAPARQVAEKECAGLSRNLASYFCSMLRGASDNMT